MTKINVVTGPLSNSGRYITDLLLNKGMKVRGLTNHPNRSFNHPKIMAQIQNIKDNIEIHEMDLDNISKLREALKEADTLFFTYWVRFYDSHGISRDTVLKRASNLIEAVLFKYLGTLRKCEKNCLYLSHQYPSRFSVSLHLRQSLGGRNDTTIGNFVWHSKALCHLWRHCL